MEFFTFAVVAPKGKGAGEGMEKESGGGKKRRSKAVSEGDVIIIRSTRRAFLLRFSPR